MEKEKEDVFNEENEVQSSWIKFSKIGDFISGTLIGVREVPSTLPGKEGTMTKVYEIKALSGEFHDIDDKKQVIEEPIVVNAGEVWNVGGGVVLDAQMRNIKIGQVIGVKFTDEKPAQKKGFNAMKIKKVFAPKGNDNKPKMDEEWLKEQEAVAELRNF